MIITSPDGIKQGIGLVLNIIPVVLWIVLFASLLFFVLQAWVNFIMVAVSRLLSHPTHVAILRSRAAEMGDYSDEETDRAFLESGF